MKRSPLQRHAPLKPRPKLKRITRAIATFYEGGRPLTRVEPIKLATGKLQRKPTKRTKHARRERAPDEWFAFVKGLPCFVQVLARLDVALDRWSANPGEITPCYGPIEADHMGDRFKDGDGTRAHDSTCGPMCHGHHMERHDFAGTFKRYTRDDMRAFLSTCVQWTQNTAKERGIAVPAC